MKNVLLALTVSILVIISTLGWMFYTKNVNTGEFMQLGLILLIAGFGLFVAYRRFLSYKSGEPQEDELSKQILQKSAASSFYISLYMWLAIMYLTDRNKTDPEIMFGWGITGMAVIFGLSWVFYYFRGLKNE
ncbi:MAG: hypothetical protein ACM3PT_07500 [Deltaproteobacteria bacterium]